MNNDHYISEWKLKTNNLSPVKLQVKGLNLTIPSGVFNPSEDLTYSSSFLLESLPENLEGKTVLDMGTGSGIIAIQSEKAKAKSVVAVDIHKKSARVAHVNALRNNCTNITFVWSDLFQNLIGGRYDYIFANLPILDVDFEELYFNLLNQYENFLTKDGELWVVFASFGDMKKANKHFDKHPNIKERLSAQKFGVSWFIYKFVK